MMGHKSQLVITEEESLIEFSRKYWCLYDKKIHEIQVENLQDILQML